MRALALCLAILLAGCAAAPATPPQVQYKTQVVDTACQWDRVILVPKVVIEFMSGDSVPAPVKTAWDDLTGQTLAHDREWRKECGK